MANAASLTNFSSPSLDIGDWLYSIYPRSAPGYLPLNSATTSYLASSYPTLFGLLNANYKVIPVATVATGQSATGSYRDVAYGNSVYVLASANGTATDLRTSTDGATWTARTGPAGFGRSIGFGLGLFVMINGNSVATSSDGITWATSTPGISFTFNCEVLFFGGGQFVAMGQNGSGGNVDAYTSPNGTTWTSRTVPALAGYERIAYGNSIYVATGGQLWSASNTTYATSPDGATWTARTLPFTANVGGLVFANGKFWMLSAVSGTSIWSSTDGINWTSTTITNIGGARGLAFDGTIFAAIDSGGTFSVSADGLNWTVKLATGYSSAVRMNYGTGGTYIVCINGNPANKISAPVSTTQFTLPVVTALTNTFTYVKAT